MANNAQFDILINAVGDLTKAIKETKSLGSAVDGVAKSQDKAAKAGKTHNDVMNGGVASANNAGRSMSKLMETVGGNNSGLVAAYATLATNAFAVSAAFTSLKSAYQAQQLLAGLEAQGARTGKTLTTVAESVRKLSGEAISAADAMRYTAQASSAGIGGKDLERLTKVATASARALGRDAPDSINRLIMAVTKAEPELVDELGLTIKLTEAQQMYARQTGKTASSLSQLEKQQALVNAWASQGEAKFGALAESVDPNPYDQLASSFTNLTNTILNFANNVGVVSMVKILGSDKLALTAALLFLVNTVKGQLLPVFAEASKAAKKLADERLSSLATERTEQEKLQKDLAAKQKASTKLVSGLTTAGITPPKGYKDWVASLNDGTNSTEKFTAAQKSLRLSISQNQSLADKAAEGNLKNGKTEKDYIEIKKAHEKELLNMQKYYTNYGTLQSEIATSTEKLAKIEQESSLVMQQAKAQDARSDAISSLSKLELKNSINSLIVSTKAYAQALQEERILKVGETEATYAASAANTLFARSLIITKASLFGAVTGVKAIGAAILEWLPYLGLAVVAWDLLMGAISMLTPDSWKKQAAAYDTLTAVVSSTIDKLEALKKIEESNSSVADKGTAGLLNRINTLAEITIAYDEYNKAIADSTKEESKGVGTIFSLSGAVKSLFDGTGLLVYGWEVWKRSINDTAGIDELVGKIYDIGPTSSKAETAAAAMLSSIHKQLPKTTEAFIAANGGLKGMSDEARNEKVTEFLKKIQPIAESAQKQVQELSGAITTLNNSYSDFINSLKVSTPYDKLSDSLSNVLGITSKLRTDLKSGIFKKEDIAKTVADLNASMGSIGDGMLSTTTKKAYDNVTLIDKAIQELKVKQTGLNSTTLDYINIQKEIESLNKKKEGSLVTFSTLAEADLKTLYKRVYQSRLDSISQQSSLALAQARLAVTERQGLLSKEDIARDIDAKNHIIKLQADIQNAQVQYLEGLQLQKKEDLDRAIRQAEELTRLQAMTEENRKSMLLAAEQALALEKGRGRLGQGGQGPDFQAIETYQTIIDKLEKAKDPGIADKATQDVEKAKRDYELFTAQVNAQKKMVEAINLGAITASEKTAQMAKGDLSILKERAQLEGARDDAIQKKLENERLIQNLASKGLTIAKNEFLTIKDTSKNKIDSANESYDFKVKELEIDKTLAAAQGRTEDVKIYEARLKLIKEEHSVTLENLNTEERLQIYGKIDLDTTEKKLALLKQVLDVQIALADQQKTMLDKEQELYRLKVENAVNKRGGVLSETAQKAVEAKAAQEQLNLAEKQLALRKIGISLEYDILEAKRVLLREELKAKKAEADKLAATAKTPLEKSAAEDLSRTLSSAIEGVGAQSYEVLKKSALRIADMDVDILRERAIKAYNELNAKFVTPNLFDKMKEAQNNAQILREAFIARKTQQNTPDQIAPKAIVDRQKELADAINTNFPVLIAQIDKAIAPKTEATLAGVSNTPSKRTLDSMLNQGSYNIDYKGEFGKRVSAMLNEYFDMTSRSNPISVVSGIRSTNRQQEIWDAGHFDESGKRVTSAGRPIAKPGTSPHEKENALDIPTNIWDDLISKGLLKKFGLGTVSGDPGHIQLDKSATNILEAAQTGAKPLSVSVVNTATTTSVPNTAAATTATLTATDTPASITAGALDSLSTVKTADMPSTDIVGVADTAKAGAESIKLSFIENLAVAKEQVQPLLEELKKLGPDGELAVSIIDGADSMIGAFSTFFESIKAGGVSIDNVTSLASTAISALTAINDASAKSKSAAIDKEISAEEKRDGKSAASVAKIAALQKKKEAEERKAFENNKKLKMAETVINTAAAIAKALPNIPMAILAGAMGAAQLAVIASASYSGYTAPPAAVSTPSTLSVGKQGDTVNLAKGPNANAGGEVGYLRGSSGTGSNASNYRTVGSAYGGDLMRGYGNRGFVVGEKGPEVITPDTPISVTPANDIQASAPINANISIHALDSHGVQDILVSQKGNIIKMLREAANASGKTFMEDVNVNVYTRPSVGKL